MLIDVRNVRAQQSAHVHAAAAGGAFGAGAAVDDASAAGTTASTPKTPTANISMETNSLNTFISEITPSLYTQLYDIIMKRNKRTSGHTDYISVYISSNDKRDWCCLYLHALTHFPI